jgi:hypothetical protein
VIDDDTLHAAGHTRSEPSKHPINRAVPISTKPHSPHGRVNLDDVSMPRGVRSSISA